WQRLRTDKYEPGTVFYRDGRQVSYRALRFGAGVLSILTEEGNRRVLFDEIAELHLPRVDPWDAYFEQLAALTPTLDALLIRQETIDGLAITASHERIRLNFTSDANNPGSWFDLVQPAWALDALRVPHARTHALR